MPPPDDAVALRPHPVLATLLRVHASPRSAYFRTPSLSPTSRTPRSGSSHRKSTRARNRPDRGRIATWHSRQRDAGARRSRRTRRTPAGSRGCRRSRCAGRSRHVGIPAARPSVADHSPQVVAVEQPVPQPRVPADERVGERPPPGDVHPRARRSRHRHPQPHHVARRQGEPSDVRCRCDVPVQRPGGTTSSPAPAPTDERQLVNQRGTRVRDDRAGVAVGRSDGAMDVLDAAPRRSSSSAVRASHARAGGRRRARAGSSDPDRTRWRTWSAVRPAAARVAGERQDRQVRDRDPRGEA